jgi:hypothetical protein
MAHATTNHPDEVYRNAATRWLDYFFYTCFSIGKFIEEDPLAVSRFFTRIPKHDVQEAINNEDVQLASDIYEYIKNMPEVRSESVYTRIYKQDLAGFNTYL